MPASLGAPEEFSADEQAVLARLIAEDASADGVDDGGTPPPPPAPVFAPPPPVAAPVAAAPAPVTTPAPQPASAAPADSPTQPNHGGNVTAALRASRQAERAAREQAAQLQAEIERLRAAAPPVQADTGLTDAELAELRSDIPAVGKLADQVRTLSEQLAAARAQAPAAPAPKPGFVPPIQSDPEVQSAIDENADALAWQHNPDQTGWNYLVAQENALQAHPVWGAKSLPERLAEAARRVRVELPSSAPTPADVAAQAAAAAAAAAARAPSTLSDINGGGSPKTPAPGVEQFMKMSDDDILLSLERLGGG